ncbi:hypothetical protein [Frigoriglobus tundricola]|uniref:Uncharacterized protein n=1 Tax=Frigoriglobus tundricola TaxID=2774151 RepID=A0A6M5Z3K2_9BACT|nr:hypothetical protein [Frigoriglobus tundricola]QJX00337.1 hypothetical protein FTUN_7963 [Frigoriglobus tundricola]
MRGFIRPVAAAAVLVMVGASASSANAQIMGGGGSSPYYSGVYPSYPSTGAALGTGGLGFNASPLYGGFRGGYGGVAGYGGSSYYSSQPYSSGGYRSNYAGSGSGSRGLFGGWRRNR